ncbi:MAG: type II secretion system protein GspG, partial [Phycisphaeraceae bacterium]|nr:type II secretion system protein GspG [Phycisphaeraceae bacterium]
MSRKQLRNLILISLLAPAAAVQAQEKPKPADQPKRYLRVVSTPDHVRLEVALRRFVPAEGDGPALWLSGVIHIGEAAYYKKVQKHLDAQDLVLFEGVGGPAFLDRHPTDAATRVRRTHSAIRFVAVMLHHHRAATGRYPADLKELKAWVVRHHPRYKIYISRASLDGWDRPLLYQPLEKKFMIISTGADAKPGGQGADRDLSFEDQKPLRPAERKPLAAGLQADLAQMLGLKFQMDQLDYDKTQFVHSDIKNRAIEHNLKGQPDPPAGGRSDLGLLMSAMNGSSFI